MAQEKTVAVATKRIVKPPMGVSSSAGVKHRLGEGAVPRRQPVTCQSAPSSTNASVFQRLGVGSVKSGHHLT